MQKIISLTSRDINNIITKVLNEAKFNALDPMNKVRIINNPDEMEKRGIHTKPGKNIPFEISTPKIGDDGNPMKDDNGNVVYNEAPKVTWASRNSVVHLFVYCQNSDGEWCLLAARRGTGGRWNVPGGYVDFGDTIKSAAARECLEETGVQIETKFIRDYYRDDNFDKRGCIDYYLYAILPKVTTEQYGQDVFASRQGDTEGESADVSWIPMSQLVNGWQGDSWLGTGKYAGGQVQMAVDIYQHVINITNNSKDNNDYYTLIQLLNSMLKKGNINQTIYKKIMELLK